MSAEANGAEQTPTETMQESVEELPEAARYDIYDLIRLVSTGVSLDSKDSQGRTDEHQRRQRSFAAFKMSINMTISVSALLHFIWLLAIGHLDIMEYLIGCGVDVNASNIEMNTPLHWVCLKGHVEVVKNLVLSGANTSLLNSHEWTPIDEAVTMGKMDVIDAINATIAELELTGVNVS
ncbi:hypothetical protein CRYUN_Cryun25bG0063100 [Craigia yunnanensis]